MEYDDTKDMAGKTARQIGVASFAIIMVILFSLYREIPETYMWIGAALFGLAVWSGASALLTPLFVDWYTPKPTVVMPPPGNVVATPEPTGWQQPAGLAQAQEWLGTVDWEGLIAYIKQPDATLSRDAVGEWVDQRFYSPRDGDKTLPFPELMVQLGAAQKVGTNGGARYIWTRAAPGILKRLEQQLVVETPLPS